MAMVRLKGLGQLKLYSTVGLENLTAATMRSTLHLVGCGVLYYDQKGHVGEIVPGSTASRPRR
jgi:hypothetical protein